MTPWLLIWTGILLIAIVFTIPILQSLLARTALAKYRLPEVITRASASLRAVLAVAGIRIIMMGTAYNDRSWSQYVDHALVIALIGTIIWFLCDVVIAVEELALWQFKNATDVDDVRIRRANTQVTLLRRLIVATLVFVGVAIALMTFPAVHVIGQSILASAGLISIVAGLAAQSTLTNVFAGIQLALSNALRVGDVVVVDGESGVIHDITLTYVVVDLWDERKLIFPSSHFTTEPFENWTRSGDPIGGAVLIDVDWTAPFAAMREELARMLATTPLWDGRTGTLSVADAEGGTVQVRISLSAGDTLALFSLMSYVREQMVVYLASQGVQAMPRTRIERTPPPSLPTA
ncbi:MAG TPA: mechanosensitive ion channel domain-containing protein [Thermomicrobiales bacterium]|nr:mechanosensitive ion channel domain-containing protein [Thermomicrobiales bacterium]